MKKLALLAATLLVWLCLLGMAYAETMDPNRVTEPSADRIVFGKNEHMVLTRTNPQTPGVLDFVIENDRMNWEDLVLSMPATGDVYVTASLKAPANAAYYSYWVDGVRGGESFTPPSDEALLQGLIEEKEAWGNVFPITYRSRPTGDGYLMNLESVSVATFEDSSKMVYMQARYSARMTAFRWYDEQMNCIGNEKVIVHYSHRNPSARYVKPGFIDESRLTYATNYTSAQLANTSAVYRQNNLDYTLAAGCSKSYAKPTTLVVPPKGATAYSYVLPGMNGEPANSVDGDASAAVPLTPRFWDRIETFRIKWFMEDGTVRTERLDICVKTPEATPWFEKVSVWSPVNVKHIRVTGDGNVIDQRNMYQNGFVHLLPSGHYRTNAPLEDARVHIVINAPANAVSYQMQLAQENIGGLYLEPSQMVVDAINSSWEWYDIEPVDANGTITHTIAPFIKDDTDTQVTLYQIDQFAGGMYGTADYFHIRWLDADGNPISTQYGAYRTADPFMLVRYGKHLNRENELLAPVDTPCYVDAANDWTLKCSYRPQNGEDSLLVELELCNDDGWKVQPNGETVFYLPYPEDFTFESGCTYMLRHYDEDYETYTLVPVISTPYGLRFTTNSLSPFELSWKEPAPVNPTTPAAPTETAKPTKPTETVRPTEAPAPNLPKTGDQTPLAWLFALALLSLTGGIALCLRRKEAK